MANQKFGGFKAQIDYYTMALLGKYYGDKINLDMIWKNQTINSETMLIIEELVYKVWKHFQKPTISGVNIGQWCKKNECWGLLQQRFENKLI